MKLPKYSKKLKKLKTLRLPFLVRRVVGFSMLPVLPPGTLVIGWRWSRTFRPGRIVIVVHDGCEKIKRLDQIKDYKIYVLGDHQDASTDSRQFGWLDIASIKAKIIWPRDTTVR